MGIADRNILIDPSMISKYCRKKESPSGLTRGSKAGVWAVVYHLELLEKRSCMILSRVINKIAGISDYSLIDRCKITPDQPRN